MGKFRAHRWRPRPCPRPRRFLPHRRLVPAAIPWDGEWPAMLPTSPSQVRQNYRPECEAALNSLTTLEFHASFQCLAVAFYLDHDDMALKRFSRFFLLRSLEHSKTAQSLMFLQVQRGGRICFVDIRKPETQQWESALQAIQDTLHLEKSVNQSLLDLHQLATNSSDAHLCHFLGTGSLDQQVESMKELGNQLGNLSNVGFPECALAEYFFDKLSLGDGDKKD
ncbi:ferritin heavy chain-like [Budorcas taxicolor]|uniref:ferritin heavy chain-like n=1 Tax=Budorcas taxicolor TaxID=37181 RepID=UPI002283A330|nr:ferritin heavy chain-like [Budorcas taxicolor]